MNDVKKRTRVLFTCVHNSARSQMAEAFLNALAGDRFEATSAGLEPGSLNPLAIAVMKEAGLDISGQATKGVFEIFKSGALFGYVIAVCDAEAAQRCPTFPGVTRSLIWSFPDPAAFDGTWDERLAKVRVVRDAIRVRIEEFIRETAAGKLDELDPASK
jgi:arsenate reductase